MTIFKLKRHPCKRTGGGWCDFDNHTIGIDEAVRLSSLKGLDIFFHEIIEALDVNEFGCKLQHPQVDRLSMVLAENVKKRFTVTEK